MKIIEKLTKKNYDIYNEPPVTIAFLGDSVTHGCFECFRKSKDNIDTVFETSKSYAVRTKEILNLLYPSAQINIINSGISGDGSVRGSRRFDRDIAPFSPDLVVVSYGLNDSSGGEEFLPTYGAALDTIFEKTKKIGAECIFLTQNYMCEKVSPHLTDDLLCGLAENLSKTQTSGLLDKFFAEAKKRSEKNGVKVCDVRASWDKLAQSGVDVTELLANKLNHPVWQFHYYMAIKLIETMFEL